MQILSHTSLSPNGNLYNKTKRAAVVGTLLAGTATAAREIHAIAKNAPKMSKTETAIAVAAGAFATFVAGGIGKLFGGIIDAQTNKDRAEQADRVELVVNKVAKSREANSENSVNSNEPSKTDDDYMSEYAYMLDDFDSKYYPDFSFISDDEDEDYDDNDIDFTEPLDESVEPQNQNTPSETLDFEDTDADDDIPEFVFPFPFKDTDDISDFTAQDSDSDAKIIDIAPSEENVDTDDDLVSQDDSSALM